MDYNRLTGQIIAAAIEVHKHLGPGLLESSYQQCFAYEMSLAKIPFQMEVGLPVEYKGIRLDCGYRIDFLVADKVVVELKSVDQLLKIHQAQLLTYMKLAKKPVGLFINFNVEVLKHGVKRLVL